MLKAFVKHKSAIVPTSASPANANIKIRKLKKLFMDKPFNIPKYIKNSPIKPLNGGRAQIAIHPVKNKIPVFGIF